MDRPALDRRLAAALDRGPLMLVAPAGGGKTTALAAALEHRGGAVAWVACEPADADPGRLLARIVGAVQAAAPGTADALAATLAAATERIRPVAAARVLAAALAELTEPLAIAVDDAELLAREAVDVLAVLAAAPAPHLRIAVATSEPLPLPATQVGAGELAFTREECAVLLGPAAQAAWQASAGRPLAIALAASTGRAPAPGEPLDEALDRLLASLDPEHRAALVDSAAAPRLDAAGPAGRCSRRTASRARWPRAASRSRSPRGRSPSHPLVREVLARRFEQERPSEYRELLHARIARALDEEGRGAEAVEHWLEVPEEAATAVARHGGAIADTAPATAERWLSRIDGAARLAPELQLLEGRLALGDGRLLDAPGPLREAVVGFEVRGDEAQAWVARLALADAFVIGERFDAAIPLAGGFERTAAPAAPMVAVTAAAALAATGAYDEAVALFERALAGPRGAPFAPFAAAFRAAWVDLQPARSTPRSSAPAPRRPPCAATTRSAGSPTRSRSRR